MRRLDLKKKIGEGGQGKVYVAAYVRDQEKDKVVSAAVKKVPLTKTDMEEVKLQAELSKYPACHRYVACYYNMFKSGKNNYIVMELIKGKELWDYIVEHDGPLRLKELKKFFRQALMGLSFIHSKGIAHGDIKLENFMVDNSNIENRQVLKYIDFGYSCSKKTCTDSPVLHATGYLKPPESFVEDSIWSKNLAVPDWVKCRIKDKIDGAKTLKGIQQADLWALGSTFAELLMSPGDGQLIRTENIDMTGRLIVNEDSRTWSASEHMKKHGKKRNRKYDRLYAVVDGLMKIDPDDRLTAKEALKVLSAKKK